MHKIMAIISFISFSVHAMEKNLNENEWQELCSGQVATSKSFNTAIVHEPSWEIAAPLHSIIMTTRKPGQANKRPRETTTTENDVLQKHIRVFPYSVAVQLHEQKLYEQKMKNGAPKKERPLGNFDTVAALHQWCIDKGFN